MSRTPTLLVFTLGALRESARRGLLPRELGDLEAGLFQGCLEAALEAGRACGCRLEVCSPSPFPSTPEVQHVFQEGADFGSRLEGAMLGAFERGAGSLLMVGTDVPGLARHHLGRALALLAEDPDRVVLGPSLDGGLYLLATSRPIPGLRTAARWCRRDTLKSLLRTLHAAGRPVVLLEPLADLDRRADLEGWLALSGKDSRWNGLVRLLSRPLATRRRPAIPSLLGHPRPALVEALAGRSPPRPVFLQ